MAKKIKKTKKKDTTESVETIQTIETLDDLRVYLVQESNGALTMVKSSEAVANKIREVEKRLRKFDTKQGSSYSDAYSGHLEAIGVITREEADAYVKKRVEEGTGVEYLAGLLEYLRREYAGDIFLLLTEYDRLENVLPFHLWQILDRLLIDVKIDIESDTAE